MIQQSLRVLLKIPIVVLNQVQNDFVCEPCTQQQNCLEHSLECSTAMYVT